MDEGEIKKFDSPFSLLQQEDSIFANLVEQTGAAQAAELSALAVEKLEMNGSDTISEVAYSTYL